ncbi:MAG: hypothetical protein LAO77_18375 [Acidobacteriia bacterium]|nr:hypothetical protein [Terriglobia bacterium]
MKLLVSLTLLSISIAAPARAGVNGRAVAAYVNVPSLGVSDVAVADTGAIPTDGGWAGATAQTAAVGGVLTADTIVSSASGALTGASAASSASLSNVVILPGAPASVTASFVRSQVSVTGSGAGGYSEIGSLTFGGSAIPVTGLPNQTVSLLGVATLIINQQTPTAQGLVVNALHLILATGEEVILSSASSSISQ